MFLEYWMILVDEVDRGVILMTKRFPSIRKIVFFSHRNLQEVKLSCIVMFLSIYVLEELWKTDRPLKNR